MNKTIRLPGLPAILSTAALCAMLSATPASATPILAITGPGSVQPGAALQLSVTASGLADLYAYQFDILFDVTRFNVDSVASGGFLGTAGSSFFDAGLVDNTTGVVTLVFESLIGPVPGASGGGTLALLNLSALPGAAGGSAGFSLANVTVYDAALDPVNVALQAHAVAVPEPSAWLLALAGLAALGAQAARRSQRSTGRSPASMA